MANTLVGRRSFMTLTAVALVAATVPAVGCNTSWIPTAQKDIPVIASIVTQVAAIALTASGNGILDIAVAEAIKVGAAAAQVSLATLQQIINDYSKASDPSILGKIDTTLTDLQQNLNTILQAAHITNPQLVAAINTGIAVALSVVASIQLLIPAPPAAAGMRKAALQKFTVANPTIVDSNQLKTMFNSVLVLNGFALNQVN